MQRTLASALVTTLLATQVTGCVHSADHGSTAGAVLLVAGGVATASGAMLVHSGSQDAQSDVWLDGNQNNDLNGFGDMFVGSMLIVAGVSLLLAGGIVELVAAAESHDPPPSYVYPPAPAYAMGASTAIVTPAEVASTDSLPVLPTSPMALRLALQVRGLALRGECDAARQTLDAVELQDVAYARALATSSAMGACAR